MFKANRMCRAHRGLGKQMNVLYESLVDILSKKVPIDGVSVKVEQIIGKIKLVEVPEGVYEIDTKETKTIEEENGEKREETVIHKRNTNEKALILLKVP